MQVTSKNILPLQDMSMVDKPVIPVVYTGDNGLEEDPIMIMLLSKN
jgi:hypothetical protein